MKIRSDEHKVRSDDHNKKARNVNKIRSGDHNKEFVVEMEMTTANFAATTTAKSSHRKRPQQNLPWRPQQKVRGDNQNKKFAAEQRKTRLLVVYNFYFSTGRREL